MSAVAVRLEAVVARLEALADSLAGGAGAAAGGVPPPPGAAPVKDEPKFVSVYKEFQEEEVAAFIAAVKAIKGACDLGIDEMAATLYEGIGKVMLMAADCAKPEQKVLMELMKPCVDLFPKAEKACFKRGAFQEHANAFKEMLSMINFLFVPKARGFVEDSYTLPDTSLNKILVKAKKMEGDEQANNRTFVKTAQALQKKLKDYVKEYHAVGVSWKKGGADAKTWTPSSSGGPPAGVPPPPVGAPPPPVGLPPPVMTAAAPAAKSSGGASGMAAVFAEINKGSSMCESSSAGGATAAFKLKKVTKEMKKAMKKQPGLKPKEKKTVAKKKAVVKAKKVKPPSVEFRQGTWWVEHQVENKEISGVELKHNVYIYNANKCTITIPGKIKSITMDKCKRVTVLFDQVISTFELVGCDSCKVYCRVRAPSIAIDKSKGTQLHFNEEAAKNPPDIVTSNISETNISMPGTDPEKDDPIEMPLPEQYITKITGSNGSWKTDTTMVTHGG